LEVEPLEVRLTPAYDVFFRSRALVAVNPPPLPLQALVLFDAQPVLRDAGPPGPSQTTTLPVHLEGHSIVVTKGPMILTVAFRLDGQVVKHPPVPFVAPDALNATFSLSGMVTATAVAAGSTAPPWMINSAVTVTGSLSGVKHSTTTASGEVIEVDFSIHQITVENQQEDDGLADAWENATGTITDGSGTKMFHPSAPIMPSAPFSAITGSFVVEDHFHQVLTAVAAPPGAHLPGPCIVDGVFNGTGSVAEQLHPSMPIVPSGGTELSGAGPWTGQLTVTITCPAPSPTAPPTMETLTIEIDSLGTFDEVLMNPMP
jgi:hypothetical protein